MLALRLLFCFLCPPLAVFDNGCLTFLIILFLWLAFWPLATGIAVVVVIFDQQENKS